MASGLEVYDSAGRPLVDMTTVFSFHQGYFDTGAANGSGAMPPLPEGKTRFYYIVSLQDTNQWRGKRPGVTITGNTINWVYQHSRWFGQFSANCRIFFGYY